MATLSETLELEATAAARRGRGDAWTVWLPPAAIALAFGPVLVLFGRDLWSRPHYQLFPLLVPGAVALAWKSCHRLGPLDPGSRQVAWGIAVLAWGLLAVSIALITPWFARSAALTAIAGATYASGGWRLVRAAFPGWAFLWLTIPPPRRFDFQLVYRLQNVVSQWSSRCLDVAGVYHSMSGNVVQVGGQDLQVKLACSGINSLFAVVACVRFSFSGSNLRYRERSSCLSPTHLGARGKCDANRHGRVVVGSFRHRRRLRLAP